MMSNIIGFIPAVYLYNNDGQEVTFYWLSAAMMRNRINLSVFCIFSHFCVKARKLDTDN